MGVYVAAANDGRTRIEPDIGRRILNAWLEKGTDQLWIDLTAPTAEQLAFLQRQFNLHPLAIEECDHDGVRPKIESFEGHLFMVVHGLNHNEGAERLDTVEFKIFLWPGHLITIHDHPSSSIRATQEQLQKDGQLLARGGIDSVLHRIVDTIIDHYFPLLEQWEDRVETIEAEIFRDCRSTLLEEMLRLRRHSLTLHRLIQPQLLILGALAAGRYPEIEPADLPYFRDVHDHLERINDRAHGVREMITAAMECYLSQSSNRLSVAMKGLAVLATVMLPMGFISGLLGMNIHHLPGRNSPDTFWAVCGIAIAMSAGLMALLRWLRWI